MRTFYIDEKEDFDLGWKKVWVAEYPHVETIKDKIHVIEYSEYEKLKKENEVLREGLKFYTLKSNYSVVDEGRNYNVNNVIYELDEETYADKELGTKAREALEQANKIREGK